MAIFNRKFIGMGIFLMSIFICGCPYSSSNPLSSAESAKVDGNLLGTWEFRESRKAVGIVNIFKFGKHEMLILAYEVGECFPDIFRAFSTEIGGETFINLQRIGGKQDDNEKWLFAKYSIVGDELNYRLISERLFDDQFMTSNELRSLVELNLKNNELYGGGNVIYRSKDL